jgi:hypothetical protein
MMNENLIIPYLGGAIECAAAMTFQGADRDGAPKTVELPDRIVVTHGRKKVTLDGEMVKALVTAYSDDNSIFREWCERCK